MIDYKESELRQLKKMHDILISYKNNLISLGSLIGSLEFLASHIEKMGKNWEHDFFDQIILLESINAEKPHMNESKINELIQEAVETLIKFIGIEINSTKN